MRLKDLRDLDLDVWQKRVINRKGNVAMRCGRQVGKSTVTAIKTHKLATTYPGTLTLVIAPALRQSNLLYEKIRAMFEIDNTNTINKAKKDRVFRNKTEERVFDKEHSIFITEPTASRIRLKNGSEVICEPCGDTGAKIRGYTVDFLIADEAHYIPEAVWVAVMPMMATSKKERGTGWTILLSTPRGKKGFFYECFGDSTFLHVHVTSEQCKRIPKVWLRAQRKRLTKIQYAQELLGEFIEDYNQFFPTPDLEKCATLIWDFTQYNPMSKYYLGVDIARYGGDKNAFYVIEMDKRGFLRGVFSEETERVSLVETEGRIVALDEKWKFKRIFIDGAGVGGGVVDSLIEKKGRKIVEINASSRSIEHQEKTKNAILKQDLYSNALILMQQGKLQFVRHYRIMGSLQAITFEYTQEGRLRIYGKNSHLAEAFVRACWCVKNKGLDLFIS